MEISKIRIKAASACLLMLLTFLASPATVAASFDNDKLDLALYNAAQSGDLAAVLELLDQGASPDAVISRSSSPRQAITVAIDHGHLPVVKALVEAGADLQGTTRGEPTPLIAAAAAERADIMAYLIQAGESPDHARRGDGSPLIKAAATGNPELVELLLQAGADPNLDVRFDGSPLIAAVRGGSAAVVLLLLDAGSDANQGVRNDGSPLISAIKSQRLDLIELLLAHGADINQAVSSDDTPLINGVRTGNQELVSYLITQGADVNQRGDFRALGARTPLKVARASSPELADVLLAAGANK